MTENIANEWVTVLFPKHSSYFCLKSFIMDIFISNWKLILGSVITNSLTDSIDLKVIQSLIQQFDIVNNFQDTTSSFEEPEEVPPIPEVALKNNELTEEELEAKKTYETAAALLAKPRPNKEKAVQLLMEASNKGNLDAKALVAWIKLFGNPLKQDLYIAKEMFAELAELGHHEGHMGLGKWKFTPYYQNVVSVCKVKIGLHSLLLSNRGLLSFDILIWKL